MIKNGFERDFSFIFTLTRMIFLNINLMVSKGGLSMISEGILPMVSKGRLSMISEAILPKVYKWVLSIDLKLCF